MAAPQPNTTTTIDLKEYADMVRTSMGVQSFKLEDGTELLSIPHEGGRTRVIKDPRDITEKYLDAPRRKIGLSRHTTLESFIGIVARFKSEDSVIFADKEDATLTAIFDYHSGGEGKAGHLHHRALYGFPKSDQWGKWTRFCSGEYHSQSELADFLEDRLLDVLDPDKAGPRAEQIAAALGGVSFATAHRLLELSRGLQLRVGMKIKQIQNTSTGECSMAFEESHENEVGGDLRIPSLFLIGIPVFEQGTVYQITVRLRYRRAHSGIVWNLEMQQPELMFEDAFLEAIEKVREATELPVFFGCSEKGPEQPYDEA